MNSEEVRTCACRYTDAYDCWSSRYPPEDHEETHQTAQQIEMDGGPCECSCHDSRDEDDPAEFL